MNSHFRIPAATLAKLEFPAAPGGRHRQILEIACSLIGQGHSPETIFALLRPKYGADVSDLEIRRTIFWAESKIAPCITPLGKPFPVTRPLREKPPGIHAAKLAIPPEEAIERFLGGFSCEEADLIEASPIKPPDCWEDDAQLLFRTLYLGMEYINIVCDFARSGEKANPAGRGITLSRDTWLTEFEKNGPPKSDSGVWVRPNPVDGVGISDANVTGFRFLLLEFDGIPVSTQISIFAQLPLPIAAVISSGGKSVHAWVRVDENSLADYRTTAGRIFDRLELFGIDRANRNPSRLSRLPGVFREIGGTAEKRQRLLYLNPFPEFRKIIE